MSLSYPVARSHSRHQPLAFPRTLLITRPRATLAPSPLVIPRQDLSHRSTRPTPDFLPPDARIAALYIHQPRPHKSDQCDRDRDRALASVRPPSVDFSFRLLCDWARAEAVLYTRPPVRGASLRLGPRAPRCSRVRIQASEFGSRAPLDFHSLALAHRPSPSSSARSRVHQYTHTHPSDCGKPSALSPATARRTASPPLHRARRSLPARRSVDPTAKATRRNPNQPTRQCVCVGARLRASLSRPPRVRRGTQASNARRKDRYRRNRASLGFEIPRRDRYPATRTERGQCPSPPPRSRAYAMSSQRTV